jgi:hypothetical protein
LCSYWLFVNIILWVDGRMSRYTEEVGCNDPKTDRRTDKRKPHLSRPFKSKPTRLCSMSCLQGAIVFLFKMLPTRRPLSIWKMPPNHLRMHFPRPRAGCGAFAGFLNFRPVFSPPAAKPPAVAAAVALRASDSKTPSLPSPARPVQSESKHSGWHAASENGLVAAAR